MKVTSLFTEERAVSSAIGTVLMVAVVVVMASVIGAFAFGLWGGTTPAPSNTGFGVEYDVSPTGVNTTTVTMQAGDKVKTNRLTVKIGDEEAWVRGSSGSNFTTSGWTSDEIESGADLTITETSQGHMTDGDTIQVIWEASSSSSVLNEYTITA
jgi:FlaG/FlaF family flagellin (archaellin)